MRLKLPYILALLAIVVFSVYFSVLSAGFNSVDDLHMVNRIAQKGPLDLGNIFFPQGKRYYFRPVTILTYFLDRDAWGSIASFMHLENVLIHLCNTLLVFAITRSISKWYNLTGNAPAFLAALLFGIHPLATESVAWISGRTDLLAGFFLLLAIWLLMEGLKSERPVWIALSSVALLTACLAKETAVFVLPGFLWLVAFFPGTDKTSFMERITRRWWVLLAPVASIVLYFGVRSAAIGRDTGIKTAVRGAVAGDYDVIDKFRVILKVYGFYFKKIFVPWPLNFGIVEISGWYVVSGVLLVFALIWLALRFDLLGSFGLMAFCVLSPAILVPFGKMAWTPIAERYLYISLALLAPMIMIFYFQVRSKLSERGWADKVLLVLLFVFFVSTTHRAWIWQDNVRLYSDTVEKSPDFLPAKAELATALRRSGEPEKAEAILTEMQVNGQDSPYLVDDMNLANILISQGEFDKARTIVLGHLDPINKQYYELLQLLLKINDQRIGEAKTLEEKSTIQQESLGWLNEQQKLSPRSFTLYRMGKLLLSMGRKAEALESFRTALRGADPDAFYRPATESFIAKLEGS